MASIKQIEKATPPTPAFKYAFLELLQQWKAGFNKASERIEGEGEYDKSANNMGTYMAVAAASQGGYYGGTALSSLYGYDMMQNMQKQAKTVEDRVLKQPPKSSYMLIVRANGKAKDDDGIKRKVVDLIPEIIHRSGYTNKNTSGVFNYYWKKAKDGLYVVYYDASRKGFFKTQSLCINMVHLENSKENEAFLKKTSLSESYFDNLSLI